MQTYADLYLSTHMYIRLYVSYACIYTFVICVILFSVCHILYIQHTSRNTCTALATSAGQKHRTGGGLAASLSQHQLVRTGAKH